MAIAGKIMPRPMGNYDPATIYNILDIVTHNERPWICKKADTQNIEPTVLNTDNWMLFFDIDISNADKLDGFDSSYFATKESVDRVSTILVGMFLSSGWVGSAAPYTQTISVQGMKDTYTPIPSLNIASYATAEARKIGTKEFGYLSYYDSGNGTVTATCMDKKPTWNIEVNFKGV